MRRRKAGPRGRPNRGRKTRATPPPSFLAAVVTLALALPAVAQPAPEEGNPASPFAFRDVAAETGVADALRGMMGHAAAWGDVDGDGRLDLFVGTFADRPVAEYVAGGADGPVPNRLLVQRNGRFTLSDEDTIGWLGRASGAVLADLDGDGRPDLYVSNNGRLGHQNRLYRNRGGGDFDDVTDAAGAPLHLPETSRSVAAADLDGDGRLELIVLGTVGRSETLIFRNLGGLRFEPWDAIPGDAHGLGLAVADATGNGWPDVFIGGGNRFFANLGGGRFREARELAPVLDWGYDNEGDSPSCGAAFGDVDRDGDLDLLVGSHRKTPWTQPNPVRLFLNEGSTPERIRFREVTGEVGIAPCPMKVPHVEIRDFDNDGWPDLYTAFVTLRDGAVHPAIHRNLGLGPDGVPRFEETALRHRPDFPADADLAPGQRTAAFYDRLVANRRVMYFAPGPSADFDGDGRLDLFLCSWFPRFPSMLLRNETPGGVHLSVGVEAAAGSGINRSGIGSVVRAYQEGRAGDPAALLATEPIVNAVGFCSSRPPIAHLGLGEVERCDLVVSLPGGRGEIVRRGVRAGGRITVEVEGDGR